MLKSREHWQKNQEENYNNSVQKSTDDVHSYENRTQSEQQSYPEIEIEIERELEREKDTETDKDTEREKETLANDVKKC